MNLFELFVKIGAKDEASGTISKITSGLGKGLATAAKIGTAAVSAAAAGITALTTAAVNNYAEYEQLVGGAELMFGKAYDTVAKNAQDAYKTVQMSQNEYLQQVNGFATGLKTALGGNEQAAAELAHNIVKAEADIIAATGNTAENVQNAFNGIMKSNFTMLDNLQIGITPTKEGFQEVIDKVNDWNKANGEATNYQMGNLADMQSALVDYIEMVGMSGYASMEAANTISGSVSSMKSAWKNLLTGLADGNADIEQLVDNLVITIVGDGTETNLGVLGNILPAVRTALNGASALVNKALPEIVGIIPTIINENLPVLAQAAVGIIQSLVDGISQNQKMLFGTVLGVVTYLAETFIELLPQIVELGLNLIGSLADGIAESLPKLIPTIVDVVIQIVETLVDNVDMLVDSAIAIITALANGLISALPRLIEKAPEIVGKLVSAIVNNAPKLIESALAIIVALANGLIASIPQLVKVIPQIVTSIVNGFKSLMSQITGIGGSIVNAIGNGITNLASSALTWGKDLIDNFVSGIRSKISAVTSAVSSVASKVKGFLGFSEPEEGPLSNFHTYAPDMMKLFAQGIRDNENVITDQIEKSFDFGERTIKFGAEYGDEFGIASSTGATFGGTSIGNVTINIDGAKYSNENSLAEAIAEVLQNMTDRRAAVYA